MHKRPTKKDEEDDPLQECPGLLQIIGLFCKRAPSKMKWMPLFKNALVHEKIL